MGSKASISADVSLAKAYHFESIERHDEAFYYFMQSAGHFLISEEDHRLTEVLDCISKSLEKLKKEEMTKRFAADEIPLHLHFEDLFNKCKEKTDMTDLITRLREKYDLLPD